MSGRLVREFWWFAFRWSAKANLPGLAARLLHGVIGEVPSPTNPDAVNLLLISKQGLAEDAMAAFGADPRFRIFAFDKVNVKALKAMISAFCPPTLDDHSYKTDDPAIVAGKAAYQSFIGAVWQRLIAYRPYDAVLSANFAYYAERPLAAALEAIGTPFIPLHKENLKTPGLEPFFINFYRDRRGPYEGRGTLVYNQVEKRIQVGAGVLPPERVTIVGMPRLDPVHAWRKKGEVPTGAKRALFFSFTAKTGLPRIPRKYDPDGLGDRDVDLDLDALHWDELAAAYHRAAVHVARQAPDVTVIVKTKSGKYEVDAARALMAQAGEIPANLKLVEGGDPLDLILASDVICGFTTTALFEALAAGKPIVCPRFAEAVDDKNLPYIVDMEDAVSYGGSEAEMADQVIAHLQAPRIVVADLSAEAMALLEKWTGNADGKAGIRVADAVLAEVSKASSS
ncbi:MAG: hypothetical protein HOK21_15825 [Rhodospirillaceae bacterium]|jgi:hypothetical protein|nr:hypothetical protein [Rhodospirillaceae bacterium]MBT4688778.1 hypothetical protein [Rhodospirillaceae bacterium]MBT5083396.1 hypothetical protein [Rhodospirillaceae bacterium]MBT5525554.1 hypothetical protein [Rhodospirillaceae bacterium]MBT5880594.1 hypothetical protein [Rhodospirillaceae bacterium]